MQLTIMPSQIEVAPPEAISGMDGSILYISETAPNRRAPLDP